MHNSGNISSSPYMHKTALRIVPNDNSCIRTAAPGTACSDRASTCSIALRRTTASASAIRARTCRSSSRDLFPRERLRRVHRRHWIPRRDSLSARHPQVLGKPRTTKWTEEEIWCLLRDVVTGRFSRTRRRATNLGAIAQAKTSTSERLEAISSTELAALNAESHGGARCQ